MRDKLGPGRFGEPVDAGFVIPFEAKTIQSAPTDSVAHAAVEAEAAALPECLTFPAGAFKQIEYWYVPTERAVWCMTHQTGIPAFTRLLMDELTTLHARIAKFADPANEATAPRPLFYVGGSVNKGVFNVGGDLSFFVDCIRKQDAVALREYANACIRLVHEMDYSLGGRVFTICMLEGDALGGGFEAAISFNHLIAERGVKLGLPESLFNAFPGMGAYSHLSRRIGHREAREMILSGKIFDAEDLYERGVVDELVEPGHAREAARAFLAANEKKQPLLLSMEKVRRRVNPVTLDELLDVTKIWVENSLQLGASDLRRMELLAAAQLRRASGRATK